MKIPYTPASIALAICLFATAPAQADPLAPKALTNFQKLEDGDIVFIESNSDNAEAIKALTKSTLTHCGIVFREGEGLDGLKVYEGAGRGEYLTIRTWQVRESKDKNKPSAIYVRRLKNRAVRLTPVIEGLKTAAKALHETKYDKGFAWKNTYTENGTTKEYVYCSELVWKAYDRATKEKIHLGSLHRIDKYITDAKPEEKESVKAILKAKLNNDISRPYRKSPAHPNGEDYKPDELAISPQEVFESDELEPVTD